eukprot:SM000095S24962  [mRNA]  locus=s95:144540:149855:- [translate_table: standard]
MRGGWAALLTAVAAVAAVAAGLAPRAAALTGFVSRDEAAELRDEVRDMFYHAYGGYMEHAFPLDELRPQSCTGEDSLGGYSLTLVDAMDTLALLGDHGEFSKAVKWLSSHLDFDQNVTVSLFETNIRVLGGLLSAHLLASDAATGLQVDGYHGELLDLADDLASRLMPAFDTPTGIPYGSVHLQLGVLPNETKEGTDISDAQCGGVFVLYAYEEAARDAVRGLWAQRSSLGLVGAHIDVFSGDWTHKDAGIGTSIDSFYEYLIKAHMLLGDDEYLHIFKQAYGAVMEHLYHDPWSALIPTYTRYLEVNMNNGMVVWPLFNSLQAFWPGLQVTITPLAVPFEAREHWDVDIQAIVGDVEPAARTHRAFFSVWQRFGFTPEGFNLATSSVHPGQNSYPLRPELAESTYWLYKVMRDPWYLSVGRDIVASLQSSARCPCGFCHVEDVESHALADHMESFFLSETVKYLWLLFDLGAGGTNLVERGPYSYIFSTEGHLFPMTPEISLPSERCSYLGSFCPRIGDDISSLHQGKHSEDQIALNMSSKTAHTPSTPEGRGSDWFIEPLERGADNAAGSCPTGSEEAEKEGGATEDFQGLLDNDGCQAEIEPTLTGACAKLSFWRGLGLHGVVDEKPLPQAAEKAPPPSQEPQPQQQPQPKAILVQAGDDAQRIQLTQGNLMQLFQAFGAGPTSMAAGTEAENDKQEQSDKQVAKGKELGLAAE